MSGVVQGFKSILCRIGISVTKYSTVKDLVNTSKKYNHLSTSVKFLKHLTKNKSQEAVSVIENVKSQIQQDLFVLLALDFKKDGFFIEFGATDGVYMSNSWIFEKEFGWQGIVAEPGVRWHKELYNNRNCKISTKCVWKESGHKLLFNEASDAGFSTINEYASKDHHSELRKKGKQYDVETISLNDLLEFNNAPQIIDYLSIDTEGSEYDILSAFDFDKWEISVITVEHNYTDNRNKIQILLEASGYKRVLTSISQFDDWYVKPEFMKSLENAFQLKLQD